MGHEADVTPKPEGPLARYLRDSRDLSTSFLFALPLLLAYEVGIVLTDSDVVNGASALMRLLIGTLAPAGWGHAVFNGCVVIAVLWAVVRTNDQGKRLWRPGTYLVMTVESVIYAFLLLFLLVWVQSIPAQAWLQDPATARPPTLGRTLVEGLVLSFGAGVYEEIFFRLFLLGGIAWVLKSGFGLLKQPATTYALFASAVIFSAFHHLSPHDPWRLDAFLLRTAGGVFLGSLYLRRGLGIAIWAHALYDVFIVIIQHVLRPA